MVCRDWWKIFGCMWKTFEAFTKNGNDLDNPLLLNSNEDDNTDKPKRYFCFLIPEEWIYLPEDGKQVAIKNSPVSTVFLLLNAMIGSGILVQPYVMSQSGLISTIVMYILCGYMIYSGVEVLALLADIFKVYNYSGIALAALGYAGGVTVEVSIVINNFGALLSYVIIIGSLLNDIVTQYSTCTSWYCDAAFLAVLPISMIVMPLCLIRRFGHLAIISYMSIFVISATVMLVIVGGPIYSERDHHQGSILIGSFDGTITSCGSIVFALGFATSSFHAYQGMEPQSIPVFNKVNLCTTVIGTLMCFITGLFGYLSFRDATKTNILVNFNDDVGAVFKVALIIHLIFYIPGDFVVFRASLLNLFQEETNNLSNFPFVVISISIIVSVTVISCLLLILNSENALGLVTDITGGMAGSVAYFIIPGIAGIAVWRNKPDDFITYIKSIALTIFGIAIFFLVSVIAYTL